MTDSILVKMLEHNNWANARIIQACAGLSDAQLDAEPTSAVRGSIRQTLLHLVGAQQGYLALLTLPLEQRPTERAGYSELLDAAHQSGEGLLTLARSTAGQPPAGRLQTRDDYYVEPWVVLVQVINHATEHREQIKSMLSALGITPPDIDGWAHGEVTGALVPMPK